jgi:hypothetical protein
MKKNKLSVEKFYFTNLESFNMKTNLFYKISIILQKIAIFISKSFSDTLLIIVKK